MIFRFIFCAQKPMLRTTGQGKPKKHNSRYFQFGSKRSTTDRPTKHCFCHAKIKDGTSFSTLGISCFLLFNINIIIVEFQAVDRTKQALEITVMDKM